MALVRMSDLYAYIHSTLREDEEIQELMKFTNSASALTKAKRIQKRRNPKGLIVNDNNLPLISFYANPGTRGENHLEYMVAFDFDIYVMDGSEETAIDIADRINSLFDGKFLDLACIDSFTCEFLTMGEVDTDQKDVYKYFTQILFNIEMKG